MFQCPFIATPILDGGMKRLVGKDHLVSTSIDDITKPTHKIICAQFCWLFCGVLAPVQVLPSPKEAVVNIPSLPKHLTISNKTWHVLICVVSYNNKPLELDFEEL